MAQKHAIPLYITAYSTIKKGKWEKNGALFFDGSHLPHEDFADAAFLHSGATIQRFYKMDPQAKLAVLALEAIMPEKPGPGKEYGTGIVLYNHISSLHADQQYAATMHRQPGAALFVYTLPNVAIGEMAIHKGLKGENCFYLLPNPDPERMCRDIQWTMHAANLEQMVAGWVNFTAGDSLAALWLVSRHPGENALLLSPATLGAQLKLFYK